MVHSIQSVEDQRSISIKQLEYILMKPLEQLLNMIKYTKEIGKKWHRICLTYDTVVSKFSQIKKNSSKLDMADQELQETRREYLALTLEYCLRINVLESRKRLLVLNSFSDIINAYMLGLQSSIGIMESANKRANELKKEVEQINKIFVNIEKEMNVKLNNMIESHFKSSETSTFDSFMLNGTKEVKGYLFQKEKKNMTSEWKRKYFQLSNGKLYCYKNSTVKSNKEIIDLYLCAVKVSEELNRNFCFEIISPNKTFIFQADSEDSQALWISALQNAIVDQIDNQNKIYELENNHENKEILKKIYEKDEMNRICVDCGDKNPTWISINLGIIMCLECSGIHRSLGTHVSKIRSVLLDKIDEDTLNLFYLLGNSFANSIFLYDMTYMIDNQFNCMLNPTMSRSERERWIKIKYLEKKCLENYDGQNIQEEFYKYTKEGDIRNVYFCIIHGCKVNEPNKKDKNRTALHYAAQNGDCNMVELLFQFGANINSEDDDGNIPIHYSARKHAICSSLLCKRGSKLNHKNNLSKSPLDIALEEENADNVTIIRLASQALEEKQLNNDEHTFYEALNSFTKEIQLKK